MTKSQKMDAINYTDNLGDITADQLEDFFFDWPTHPDAETHIRILAGSYKVWLAMNGRQCVGRINAISDGVFYAYIPLLEVLSSYRGKGIGRELVKHWYRVLQDSETRFHQKGIPSFSTSGNCRRWVRRS